ncbi:MAG TPA: DUF2203 domain-containing protein [Candidatus Limnocylindria bacterium]
MARRRRKYTIEEANALVPEVRAVLLQIAVEQRRLEEAVRQRDLADGNGRPADPARVTQDIDAIAEGIRALLAHLETLGIQLRDPRIGLVDFPGERDGRPVWLCWRLSDPAVAHWHATDEGFASRRPW